MTKLYKFGSIIQSAVTLIKDGALQTSLIEEGSDVDPDDRVFLCFWSHPDGEEFVDVVDISYFCAEYNYETEDVEAVKSLSCGQCHIIEKDAPAGVYFTEHHQHCAIRIA